MWLYLEIHSHVNPCIILYDIYSTFKLFAENLIVNLEAFFYDSINKKHLKNIIFIFVNFGAVIFRLQGSAAQARQT